MLFVLTFGSLVDYAYSLLPMGVLVYFSGFVLFCFLATEHYKKLNGENESLRLLNRSNRRFCLQILI
jgi:hypothetical protein